MVKASSDLFGVLLFQLFVANWMKGIGCAAVGESGESGNLLRPLGILFRLILNLYCRIERH